MRKELKVFFGIFLCLAASRFIPHPPNFTSLIALSFYVPVFFGIKFIPVVLISYVLTDIVLGYHNTLLFTWGSVVIIGFFSKFFFSTMIRRLGGALLGATLFYILTNFGVWATGYYGYTLNGLVASYFLALPFFGYTVISTFVFSVFIETVFKFYKLNFKNI